MKISNRNPMTTLTQAQRQQLYRRRRAAIAAGLPDPNPEIKPGRPRKHATHEATRNAAKHWQSTESQMNARMDHCITCIDTDGIPIKLKRVNLSAVMARKGCPKCKRKFDFFRTDTQEGRTARAQNWHKQHQTPAEPEGEIL